MRRMRAARLFEPGRIECEEARVPALEDDDQVLVRTLYAGICGTDVHHVFHGLGPKSFPCPYGFPGHEGVGEVIASRSKDFAAGDLVLTVPHYLAACGFAEVQLVGEEFLIPIEPELASLRGLLAQQLGTVLFALRRFWTGPGEGTAAVIGQGPAGLMFAKRLKDMGFEQVVVSDLERRRLEAARLYGADVTVHAPRESIVEATMKLTNGRGAELVVEAAGHDSTKAEAVHAVAREGRIGFFGLSEGPDGAPFPFHTLFLRQPTISVAHGAQLEAGLASFRQALDEIRSGRFDPAPLVTHTFTIEDIHEALEVARGRRDGALKIVIEFPSDS